MAEDIYQGWVAFITNSNVFANLDVTAVLLRVMFFRNVVCYLAIQHCISEDWNPQKYVQVII